MSPKQVWAGLLVALVIIVASNSLFVVKETERGVLLKFGEVVNPDLKPGLHVKIPFVNNHRIFDGRILTVDSAAERFFTQEKKSVDCRFLRKISRVRHRNLLHLHQW